MPPESASSAPPRLRLALPKGRMQTNVLQLLADAGMPVQLSSRDYRPRLPDPTIDCKLLKPQNVVEMLHQGTRDLGFAGADWVAELDVPLVELLDTRLDPVRIVAAAPRAFLRDGALPQRPFVVASEYERLTTRWLAASGREATFVRSYGATEAFPPDDADVIVDNAATGDTLAANGLAVCDELLRSTTRLYAGRDALADPLRAARIDEFVQLLRSVLDARARAMLDVNVDEDRLAAVVAALPAMQQPTIATLHGGNGFAVRAAVPRQQLPELLLRLRRLGARDLVVSNVSQLLP